MTAAQTRAYKGTSCAYRCTAGTSGMTSRRRRGPARDRPAGARAAPAPAAAAAIARADSRRDAPRRASPGRVGGRRRASVPYAVVRDVCWWSWWRQTIRERSVGRIGAGRALAPVRKRSTPRAAERPSAMAQTMSDWPRPASPATKTPATLVA